MPGYSFEFDGATDLTKWTALNLGTATTRVINSRAIIDSPGQGAYRFAGLALDVGTGTWRFRAKLTHAPMFISYPAYGLFVRRTANNYISFIANMAYTTNPFKTYWHWNLNASYAMSGEAALQYGYANDSPWWEVESDGVSTHWRVSSDGVAFYTLTSQAYTAHLGGAPDQVGFSVHPYNQPVLVACDWFRRMA